MWRALSRLFGALLPDRCVPDGIPKGAVLLLLAVVMATGLSAYRLGDGNAWQGWLHVFETWVLTLVLIPAFTALVSMPLKWRDPEFDVRMAYYLGVFVSLLFLLAKLRYWR
ncbi:hypothetical protein B0181_01530 [Moraxella caviae]|uniref:Uncharacterized protein n=1 Tax=Moraxella caviae TaxID=34060 RepID=A0A1T0ABI4_9GAMM|nr:hypothetical protein [Moraxella caviae]OOR92661.1 hypothetical protein B0181_01530 [Moraxella caviae]STZ14418.1 Uncharacterised protein [Moraxella caviae]VEW10495.1 Uncharacterised protein [Moraxella caviae]